MTETNTKFFAFLRAINVGGHNVKMEELRQICELPGFLQVETFIASGNVIFETSLTEHRLLEKMLEDALQKALGYAVAVFIRTPAELTAVATYRPFPQEQLDSAAALNVAFLGRSLQQQETQKLMTRKTEIDDFHITQQEIYWLCKMKQSDSKFSNAVLEKTIGQQATLRGIQTIRKMAAKYADL
jgi:uncharacterized protein (DUF1697 family)